MLVLFDLKALRNLFGWVSLFAGLDSIRDCIAFPKNNSGRDVMLDAPAALDQSQLDELNLVVDIKEDK